MMHRVFVYGTLKSGFFNHRLLGGCEFFGGGVAVPTYKMIETGYKMIENGFPVIMPDPEGKPLAGEIYTVDDKTLARLDQLEREGSSYDRKLIDVTLPLGLGLVQSLSRPGGNITGLATVVPEDFLGKRIEILLELVLGASKIALLVNPRNPWRAVPVAGPFTMEGSSL